MNSVELLNVYETVAAITADMLSAARARDWELLAKLEDDCNSHVNTLKECDAPTTVEHNYSDSKMNEMNELSAEYKERKISIIKKILSDDRAIRDITEPWMAELSALMQSANTSRKLSHSYGSNQLG